MPMLLCHSGIGVALSVLGNNNSSLIGVAISASLLPPAVNCGMAVAFALVLAVSGKGGNTSNSGQYSSVEEFLVLGGHSLALTGVNIVAIFCSALGMFRLKEVAPVVNKVAFWNEDVKICRGFNKKQKR